MFRGWDIFLWAGKMPRPPSAVLLMGGQDATPSLCRLAYGQERFTPLTASLSKGFSGQKCLG